MAPYEVQTVPEFLELTCQNFWNPQLREFYYNETILSLCP